LGFAGRYGRRGGRCNYRGHSSQQVSPVNRC
jgi:hypothetical protein